MYFIIEKKLKSVYAHQRKYLLTIIFNVLLFNTPNSVQNCASFTKFSLGSPFCLKNCQMKILDDAADGIDYFTMC